METNKPQVILIAPGAGIDTRLLMTELKEHNINVLIVDELPVMTLRPRHTVPELIQITACDYNPKRDKHSNQTKYERTQTIHAQLHNEQGGYIQSCNRLIEGRHAIPYTNG